MYSHCRPDKVRTEEGKFLMGEAGRRQEADLDPVWDMGLQTPDQRRLEVAGVKAVSRGHWGATAGCEPRRKRANS